MSAAKASSARERGRTDGEPQAEERPGHQHEARREDEDEQVPGRVAEESAEIDFGVHHSSVESEYPRRPESEGDRDRDRQQPERKQLLANCGTQSLLAQPDQQHGAHENRGEDDELDAREGREECERDEQEL